MPTTPTTVSPRPARPAIAARLRQPGVVAPLVFALAMAAAVGVAALVGQQWQEAAHRRFVRRTAHLDALLRQKLVASETMLRGARGLLGDAPAPDQARWQRYVTSLDLDALRSPAMGLGFVPVAADDAADAAPDTAAGAPLPREATRAAAPTLARNATTATTATAPPATAQSLPASPVTALYAPPGSAAERHALADDPATRAALREAASSGRAALAAVRDGSRTALTLYLPVYGAAPAGRPAEHPLAGYVFAPLDAQRLFEPLVVAEPGIALEVRAGEPPSVLYANEADEADDQAAPWRQSGTFALRGTPLTLSYRANGSPLLTGAAGAAATVLLAGAAGAAALALLAWRLARRPAWSPATAPGGDARLDEARMMGIIRSSMEAIITVDETQTIVIFNPAAEFVFGVSAMEAVGTSLERFIPARFRGGHAKHVEQFGVTGVTERQMGRQQRVLYGLRANGEEFPIEASISQIRDVSGKLYTVMLRDITERLRAETSLRQSREELRELSANLQNVREEEKTRIARELHDDLGQQLTALKIDLSALEHALARADVAAGAALPAEVATRLGGMRRLIDATVASVRRIAADLRPVMLDDLGLVPAIEWLAADFTNRYGIDVERHVDTGGTTFSTVAATTLFRIVQEAFTNVARHADATRVVLTLEIETGRCALRIVDNGRGARQQAAAAASSALASVPAVAAAAAGGKGSNGGNGGSTGRVDKSFGLLGIRERAHMLGGTVTIDTSPDEGFAIAVTFPLEALQPQETLS